MSPEHEDIQEEESIPVVHINIEDQKIMINNPAAQLIFENGYFGQWINDDTLLIEPEEILLLIDRRRIEVINSKTDKKLSSSELVAYFSKNVKNFWNRYLVYKDLRNRGYVVQIGPKITAPFRIYARGGKPGHSVSKIIIYPLPEGEDLDLDFLDQIVKQSKIDRKKLLLSVIDRLGDVTYYQASQLDLEPNELEYEYRDELTPTDEDNSEE